MPMTRHELPPPTYYERFKRRVRRHGVYRHVEGWLPLLLAVAAGAAMRWVEVSEVQAAKLNADVLPLAVSVAAILAGFQGAMHAIFLAVIRTRTVRYLREKNAYGSLMQFIWTGVVSLVAFVAVAMTVISLNAVDLLPQFPRVIYGVLVGLFTFALLSSSRIMLLLLRLLKHADEQVK
jgi:hypothetical protein